MVYWSEWHTPAAVILTRTSPGRGSGVGTSRISGCLPIAVLERLHPRLLALGPGPGAEAPMGDPE